MREAQYVITAPDAESYSKLEAAIRQDIKALSEREDAASDIEFDSSQHSIHVYHEFDIFNTIVGVGGKAMEIMPIKKTIYGLFDPEGDDTAIIGEYKVRRTAGNPWAQAKQWISDAESRYPSLPPKHYFTCAETKPQSMLCAMLETAPGVCLGETHIDPISRDLLTSQMAELRKLGVGAIFVENLRAEFNQDLDQYIAHKEAPMPPVVKDWLDQAERNLQSRFPEYKPKYATHRLLEEAKKHGIKVYGLSTELAFRPLDRRDRDKLHEAMYHRGVVFNDFAAKTVRQYSNPAEKIIVLTGGGHATGAPMHFTDKFIPGLDRQLTLPSLLIESAGSDIAPCIVQPHHLREQNLPIPYQSESDMAKYANRVLRGSEADYIAYISPTAISLKRDMETDVRRQ